MSRRGWRRLFRIGGFLPDAAEELREELDFHFRRTVEDLVAAGWSEADARREAARRFGDRDRWIREMERIDRGRVRMEGWTTWMADRWADLRISLRGLARRPGFAAAVVATFALGIGANAALFGIVDRLLLRPPAHVVDAGAVRLLQVQRDFIGRRITSESLAWDDYRDFKRVPGFQEVAAFSGGSLTLGGGEGARRISIRYATHEIFPLLGVQPHLGRMYGADDDVFGAPLVAVLGFDLWRTRFGGDPGVLGTTVRIAGAPYTVVGVAPRGFTGTGLSQVDAWLPLRPAKVATDGSDIWFSTRGYQWVRAVARLAPGAVESVLLEQATSLHRAGRQEDVDAGRYDREAQVVARPLVAGLAAPPDGRSGVDAGRVALWLAGVSALVLLIACANVANLLLARSLRQQRESAVRLALGVSPWRLVQQRVLDTLVLAALGGAAGLAVAGWGGSALRARLLPDVDWSGAAQGRVVAFTLLVSLLAGLVAAAAPAALAARQRLGASLAQGARGSAAGTRLRGLLSLGQATLATLLLVGAGLFVRSLAEARQADLGFDVDHILAVDLEPSSSLEGAELVDYYARAVERAAAVPGVRAAAASNAPFGWSFSGPVRAEGLDSIPVPATGGPYYHRVSADFFATMGLRVARGRGLRASDFGGPPAVVLNETMAELLWPGEDPLGRCLYVEQAPEACTTVVGVIAYANQGGFAEERRAQYYLPLGDDGEVEPRGMFVRVEGDPEAAVPALTRALAAGLPGTRLVRARPMRELLDPEFRGWKLGTTVFSLFGALALLVAGVGLYSLLAFDVAERRREIGIRLAVGATPRRIHGHVLGRALALATGGVALGLGAAFVLAPRAADLLFGVAPRDPIVFALAALALMGAAALAGVYPARRATRVQPTEALRVE